MEEEIELLLTEPKNVEYNLNENLPAGPFDHYQAEDDHTLYWNGGTEQAFTEDEVDEFLEQSKFGIYALLNLLAIEMKRKDDETILDNFCAYW
ncbi:hypothetical protein EJB05_22166 [Eragrostis curvula]|uniref:Uncharacterized protein n=1 Tax=Eragrostis curvula TaxID=38414 RepID=A0A5J9V3R4_9POAL|nr:hypothetical protein EJB05_22166 [Eragrostis curvula]